MDLQTFQTALPIVMGPDRLNSEAKQSTVQSFVLPHERINCKEGSGVFTKRPEQARLRQHMHQSFGWRDAIPPLVQKMQYMPFW